MARLSAEVWRLSLGQPVLSHYLIEGRESVATHPTHKLNVRFTKPSAV